MLNRRERVSASFREESSLTTVRMFVELYEVPYTTLREELLPNGPPELELGVIELADESGSLSMRLRGEALFLEGVTDISERGGWPAHRASLGEGPVGGDGR